MRTRTRGKQEMKWCNANPTQARWLFCFCCFWWLRDPYLRNSTQVPFSSFFFFFCVIMFSGGEEGREVRPLSPGLPFPASSDRDLRSYWVKVKGLPPRAGEASGGSDGWGEVNKLPVPKTVCGHTAWECCGRHGVCPPPRLTFQMSCTKAIYWLLCCFFFFFFNL